MITDPKESWLVKRYALDTMKHLPAKAVVPHVDKIIPYLKHEEWWLQKSALNALVPVMADPACYELQGNSVGGYDYLFKKAKPQELSPELRKLLKK